MGRKDGQPAVLERGQRHQRVAVRALAADLVAVGARGLVAVVAVGDQQLRVGELCRHRLVHRGVGDPPDAVHGAVVVGHLAPGVAGGRRLDLRPGVGAGEGEDRREVVAGGAGEVEAVLLGPRLGALVGPHSAGPVVLDPHPGEDRVAGESASRPAPCSPGSAPRAPARGPGAGCPPAASPRGCWRRGGRDPRPGRACGRSISTTLNGERRAARPAGRRR